MAGNLTIETCGNVFQPTSRQASSHYGIGSDGRIGMYVEEKNRAWTSSNSANDNVAVTIEVANISNATGEITEKAWKSLVALCVDICKRNEIKKLNFTGNANGNLTYHSMFKATSCPGKWLRERFPKLAEEVNKQLTPSNNKKKPNKPSLKRNLKKGDSGDDVKALRKLLKYHGLMDKAGKLFGTKTLKAVKAFQKSKGLSIDGIVGPKTWEKL